MKAKGLSKLKYYCQMCNKQCRDANGFKCHSQSDSHRQQMELFLSDPEKFVNDFSNQFEEQFIDILRDASKGDWIPSRAVYGAVVADKEHVHMNATKWATLTEFLEHLMAKGTIRIKETEHEGQLIQFIDVDRERALVQQAQAEAKRLEKEQRREQLEKDNRLKIMLAYANDEDKNISGPSGLTRADSSQKVVIQLGTKSFGSTNISQPSKKPKLLNPFSTSDSEPSDIDS